MEGHHVVARDGLDGLLGHGLADTGARRRRAPSETRVPAIAPGWAFACASATSRCAAEAFERVGRERRVEQHVGEDVERRAELRRRRHEADRRGFVADARRDVRAEQLQRVRELLAVPGRRALAQHRRREAPDAAAVRRLELVGAAEERDRERDERQVALLGDDQLGAVRQRRSRPRRHAQNGRRPGAGTFVRSSVCCAATGSGACREQQHERPRGRRRRGDVGRFIVRPPEPASLVAGTFVLSPAWRPGPAFPSGTTLSTTRPGVRYLLATRFTSAAVTASDFWYSVRK